MRRLNQGQSVFRSWDYFGTPIKVNLEGETTYKTCFGAVLTVIFAAVMCTQCYIGFNKMVNRTDPDYSFYRLTQSWPRDDPLNVADIGGQMYIGLVQTTDYSDGSKVQNFIDFDPAYLNGKIDYYDQSALQARKDMPRCADIDDYASKIKNSNGLTLGDFAVMRCVPAEFFEFYNVAGTSEDSSISLIFEECGGKYEKEKEFTQVLQEQAIEQALALGQDPATIQLQEPVWEWTDPACDGQSDSALLSDCSYGLEPPPPPVFVTTTPTNDQETQQQPNSTTEEPEVIVYEDCSLEEAAEDENCVEYWDEIQCEADLSDSDCLILAADDSCFSNDINCEVNFMRAFCEQFAAAEPACTSLAMQRVLQKTDDCLPGDWGCPGYQEMFGGPSTSKQCAPYDLACSLEDRYGSSTLSAQINERFPFMSAMPRSSLTVDDLDKQEYILYLLGDLDVWRDGLAGEQLIASKRKTFHSLGVEVMGAEGFNDLYQGIAITNKLQTEIDSNLRLFNLVKLDGEPVAILQGMPATTIKQVEWAKASALMHASVGDIWTLYDLGRQSELTTAELAAVYAAEEVLFGNDRLVEKRASATLSFSEQQQIDASVREYIWRMRDVSLRSVSQIPTVEVIPRMLHTYIRLDDWDRISVIQKYLISEELYESAFIEGGSLPADLLSVLSQLHEIQYGSLDLYEEYARTPGAIGQDLQGRLDSAFRAFLLTYAELKSDMVIYSGPKGDILRMLDSSLTEVEWARIVEIMAYKLGSNAFETKFAGGKISQRQEYAFSTAMTQMLGQSIYLSLWEKDQIGASQQSAIDQNIRAFIASHEELSLLDQVIPRMPFTTLRLIEIGLIEQIITFQVDDLWVRVFDRGELAELTDAEFDRLTLLGYELMGKDTFQVYLTTDRDLTSLEQASADPLMFAYLQAYRVNVEMASRMPYTVIESSEFELVEQIKTFQAADLWIRAYVYQDVLTDEQTAAVHELGLRMFGSEALLNDYLSHEGTFDLVLQPQIDFALFNFLARYQYLSVDDIIYYGPKTDILRMAQTTLTEPEWDQIERLMELKLGNDSFSRLFKSQFVTLREEDGLEVALVQLFGDATLADLWLESNTSDSDSIAIDTQRLIDDGCRQFIAEHQDWLLEDNLPELSPKDQIVPRMPFTEKSLAEIALLEEIVFFKVGSTWVDFFDYGESRSLEELAQLQEIGVEMLGSQGYGAYLEGEISQAFQSRTDSFIDEFLAKYRDDVELASIAQMPHTSLTVREYTRLLDLINYELEDASLWSSFVDGGLASLPGSVERSRVSEVGQAWMGDNYFIYYTSVGRDFETVQQAQVDINARDYLATNASVNTSTRRQRRLQHSIRKHRRQRSSRSLQAMAQSEVASGASCASAKEIREYLQDKTIVVYSTVSFVRETSSDSSAAQQSNELVQYLEPVAEKRLDFKYHKRIEAVIQKQNIELQDSYYQIFQPDPQLLTFPQTRVQHEDVVTREYWDGDTQEYVNTQESMLAIRMRLLTTTTEQKRVAYDSMTFLGDIGGLYDFFVILVTPCVGLIVGDRLTHHLLKQLFMVNTEQASQENGSSNFDQKIPLGRGKVTSQSFGASGKASDDDSDPEAKKNRWRSWLGSTKRYETNFLTRVSHNKIVRCIRMQGVCRRRGDGDSLQTVHEQVLRKGERRVKRDLDIRNLIKAQDTLRTFIKLYVTKREKRKLLRLQRANVVLEPDSGESSHDSEDDFIEFRDSYALVQADFENLVDDEKHFAAEDEEYKRLFKGILEKDALDPKPKVSRQQQRQKRVAIDTSTKPIITGGKVFVMDDSSDRVAEDSVGDISAASHGQKTAVPVKGRKRRNILAESQESSISGQFTRNAGTIIDPQASMESITEKSLHPLNKSKKQSASVATTAYLPYDQTGRVSPRTYDLSGAAPPHAFKQDTSSKTSPRVGANLNSRLSKTFKIAAQSSGKRSQVFVRNQIVMEDLHDLEDLTEGNEVDLDDYSTATLNRGDKGGGHAATMGPGAQKNAQQHKDLF